MNTCFPELKEHFSLLKGSNYGQHRVGKQWLSFVWKRDSLRTQMHNSDKNADFIYHYYQLLALSSCPVRLGYTCLLWMHPTFPLITPENDTPCLAVMSAGSLKYRVTRDRDLLLNSSKLSISPENTSVTSKFDTLKQQKYQLELCIWTTKTILKKNSFIVPA